MKTKLLAFSLFAATAATVTFLPTVQHALATPTDLRPITEPTQPVASITQPKIEVVFVLDTTGSMSGLIESAKEKIWSIANTMASAQTAPEIKIGLVAYRDRGDAYITQSVALSSDLDSMYAKLMDFKAEGGGDTPESVNQALHDAVNKMAWSDDQDTYKVVFLVGDAPAHMDYQDDVKYPTTMALAADKGIIINTIQCGQDSNTTTNWQQVASLGHGNYFQVEQSGNAVAIATPFDKKLAALSEKLDESKLYFGNEAEQAKLTRKTAAVDKLNRELSDESKARRATFNASVSGKTNAMGEHELIEEISSGRIALADIPQKELPKPLQVMSPEARQVFITEANEERSKIEFEIEGLAKQRDDFLKQEVEKDGGAKDSLDAQIYSSIKMQAKEKGLIYDDDSLKY